MNSAIESRIARSSALEVARRLEDGAVVLLPTETVYGLAAMPDRGEAKQKIYDLKGRPEGVNLPVVIGSLDQAEDLGLTLNRSARQLAKAFWPGPLTLVMGFSAESRRPCWLSGREEVAIRLPDHELLKDIALAVGPYFLTSANRHGDGEKVTAKDALESLLGTPDLTLDGGRLSPSPSTIVNTRFEPARIERSGVIDSEQIREALHFKSNRGQAWE